MEDRSPDYGELIKVRRLRAAPPRDVPIYRLAVAPDGRYLWDSSVIDLAYRLPFIVGSPRVFALRMPDAAMSPWCEANELIYIDPDRATVAGDYAMVELADPSSPGSGQVCTVRRVLKTGPRCAVLATAIGAKPECIASGNVLRFYRVLRPVELYGLFSARPRSNAIRGKARRGNIDRRQDRDRDCRYTGPARGVGRGACLQSLVARPHREIRLPGGDRLPNLAFQYGKARQVGWPQRQNLPPHPRMAKELAMVENNDAGRLARRYFIWAEGVARRVFTASGAGMAAEHRAIIADALAPILAILPMIEAVEATLEGNRRR